MKALPKLLFIVIVSLNNAAWAYGGGGSSSSKACAKPKFSDFIPAEKGEAASKSEFSFIASSNTQPESIKVSIQDTPITLKIDDKNGTAFKVSGTFPATLAPGFVRININGEAGNKCKGTGGWLVKINP